MVRWRVMIKEGETVIATYSNTTNPIINIHHKRKAFLRTRRFEGTAQNDCTTGPHP